MVLYMARPGWAVVKLRDSVRTETSATFCKAVLCYWNETVLYTFTGTPDGEDPLYENLAFDQAGNIYGTTVGG
jgi:hypothetical protein